MLFGALIFAAITGQMASRFMATKGAVQAFNTRMDEVRQYCLDSNINVSLRRRIEAHFNLLWGKTAIYDEQEILALLPRVLRDPIIEQLYVICLPACQPACLPASVPLCLCVCLPSRERSVLPFLSGSSALPLSIRRITILSPC